MLARESKCNIEKPEKARGPAIRDLAASWDVEGGKQTSPCHAFPQHEKAVHRASDQALILSCEAPRLSSHPYLFLRVWHLWDHSPSHSLLDADEYHQSRAARQRSYYASSWREKHRDAPLFWHLLRAQHSSSSRCEHPTLMPRGLTKTISGGRSNSAGYSVAAPTRCFYASTSCNYWRICLSSTLPSSSIL